MLDLVRALDPAVAYAGALGFLAVAAGVRALRSERLRPADRPRVTRAASDNHGHADWMPMGDARRLFPGPDPGFGGIVVGEAYRVDRDRGARGPFDPADPRSWGRGGTAPLLVDPCRTGPTHALVLAGSGGLKTTAVAVPTLLAWTGAAVVLDPSRELGPMLATCRERELGHEVVTLDPTDPASGAFDALDWIDPASPLAEADVEAVATWLAGEPPRGAAPGGAEFFRDAGKALIACVLADVLWDPTPGAERTLRRVRRVLVTPEEEMRQLLRRVHAGSPSPLARDLAGTLMGLVPETFSGVYANADQATRWLSTRAFADLVSGDGFRTRDLCDGRLTVFVQVPLKVLQSTPGLGRVVVGALLNAVYEADGRVQRPRPVPARRGGPARADGRARGGPRRRPQVRADAAAALPVGRAAGRAVGQGGRARLARLDLVADVRRGAGPGDGAGAVRGLRPARGGGDQPRREHRYAGRPRRYQLRAEREPLGARAGADRGGRDPAGRAGGRGVRGGARRPAVALRAGRVLPPPRDAGAGGAEPVRARGGGLAADRGRALSKRALAARPLPLDTGTAAPPAAQPHVPGRPRLPQASGRSPRLAAAGVGLRPAPLRSGSRSRDLESRDSPRRDRACPVGLPKGHGPHPRPPTTSPPFGCGTCPVVQESSPQARNRWQLATPFGWPGRLIGTSAPKLFTFSSGKVEGMGGVRIDPGATPSGTTPTDRSSRPVTGGRCTLRPPVPHTAASRSSSSRPLRPGRPTPKASPSSRTRDTVGSPDAAGTESGGFPAGADRRRTGTRAPETGRDTAVSTPSRSPPRQRRVVRPASAGRQGTGSPQPGSAP